MSNDTSRQEFLVLSGAALAAASLGAQTPQRRLFAYVGYVCNQQSGDVTTFLADGKTGAITQGSKVDLSQAGVISFALI